VPAYSKIAAGEKCKIVVKVTPGVPDSLDEVILVEISYYEPIMFRIKA